MKKELDENTKLTPYKIGVSHLQDTLSVDDVLKTVFSYDIQKIQDNEDPTIVDETFLLHLAYGIYGIGSYNPKKSQPLEPFEVKEKTSKLMELYPSRADAACIFLNYFETATEMFGENSSQRKAKRTLKRIKPEPGVNPISFFPKSSNSEQINAMCHDIRLLQLNDFMNLMYDTVSIGKAIPENNYIIERSNQLYNLLTSDIRVSTSQSKKKIATYLQVAHHLLEDPDIIDLQSASLISLVLNSVQKECLSKEYELSNKVSELAKIFSPSNNFPTVRAKMKTKLCIPHYFVINKDFTVLKDTTVFNQLTELGKLYHYLFNTFSTLQTYIDKTKIFYPNYRTDLPILLKNANKILEEHEKIKIEKKNKQDASKSKRASIRMSLTLSLSSPKELPFFESTSAVSQRVRHNGPSEVSPDNKKNETLQNTTSPRTTIHKEVQKTDSIPVERIKSFKKRSATFSHHAVYKVESKEKSISLSPLLYPSESPENNNNTEEKLDIQNIETISNSDGENKKLPERKTSPQSSKRRLAYTNSRGKDQLNPNIFFESNQAVLNIHMDNEEVEMEKNTIHDNGPTNI